MNKIFFISECGINANGSVSHAKEQIRQSKYAKASAVKFQIYNTHQLFEPTFPYFKDSLQGMFSPEQHEQLAKYAESEGIEWFASPFHPWAVELMEKIGVKRYKVASRIVEEPQVLYEINKTRKPVIMSVGMSNDWRIDEALKLLINCHISILYCVCKYPSSPGDFDFNEMLRLKNRYNRPIGFSSHCPKIEPTLEAIKLGATIIEHHTTMSRELPGCDQSSSLLYSEFRELVKKSKELDLCKN